MITDNGTKAHVDGTKISANHMEQSLWRKIRNEMNSEVSVANSEVSVIAKMKTYCYKHPEH